MKNKKSIHIRGAKEHNLKNIDVDIPRDSLTVITGISGSGKSSLAFDTIYAEGQRRYVESLSSYARQFLEQMQKPDLDHIEGLPPTISIEQRKSGANPRSTVATTTEIYDYLRLLFARIGEPFCYKCGKPISKQTPQQIVDSILSLPEGKRIMVLAPVVRGRKGGHKETLRRIRREGFVRVRLNDVIKEIHKIKKLDKRKKHEIDVVVDRLFTKKEIKTRLTDSVEVALKMGEGIITIAIENEGEWEDILFSELYACPNCNVSIPTLEPRMFSFNSPYGACQDCAGLGTRIILDEDLIIPDKELSLFNGAVEGWTRQGKKWNIYYWRKIRKFCSDFDIDGNMPLKYLDDELYGILLNGTTEDEELDYGAYFEGVIPELQRRFNNTTSNNVKRKIMRYMSELPCKKCKGSRLRPESLAVKINNMSILDILKMTIEEAYKLFSSIELTMEKAIIGKQPLKEIRERLKFMRNVGLSYLTLDRKSGTLSGGEAQRIRLATQVGSGLVGVCYVLDEPTIGLHFRDNEKLLRTLKRLRDIGNTVIIVEHDESTIRSADHIIDMGPGAGNHGGKIVGKGPIDDILNEDKSITGKYLKRIYEIEIPKKRRPLSKNYALQIKGARENNLKDIDIKIPLGGICCITGVSGSGKSTLITEILYKALSRKLHRSKAKPGDHDLILGIGQIDKVIAIDQSPIGRTPRSNPATYTKVFDQIRKTFAKTKEAKIRGYTQSRFSFNVKGGRCEECQGQGTKKIEMHFLPDVYMVCEECKGRRYNRETLEIKFKGKNIADILDMTVEEALDFFKNFRRAKYLLKTLYDVGLGYMTLGQPSTTLSGGEAQRVKLSSELAKVETGRTLYILDEPTTGLHFADINKLLNVLITLADKGNSVVIIEHNMDVIKCADYIIDLGPEGGEEGGTVVAEGKPEEIIKNKNSYTGEFLKKYLDEKSVCKSL